MFSVGVTAKITHISSKNRSFAMFLIMDVEKNVSHITGGVT